jgi:hypothetical protein
MIKLSSPVDVGWSVGALLPAARTTPVIVRQSATGTLTFAPAPVPDLDPVHAASRAGPTGAIRNCGRLVVHDVLALWTYL